MFYPQFSTILSAALPVWGYRMNGDGYKERSLKNGHFWDTYLQMIPGSAVVGVTPPIGRLFRRFATDH